MSSQAGPDLPLGTLSPAQPLSPRQPPWRGQRPLPGEGDVQGSETGLPSCLDPGAGACWLLRSPGLALAGEETRSFPLSPPAAIVAKVNTPHSLSASPSARSGKNQKPISAQHREIPGLLCVLWPLENRKHPDIGVQNQQQLQGLLCPQADLPWPCPPVTLLASYD